MPAKLEFFSKEVLALNKEVQEHPPLALLLTPYKADDFPGMLGEIAAYCGVGMHGVYSPEEIDRVCGHLVRRLQEKRTIQIVTAGKLSAKH